MPPAGSAAAIADFLAEQPAVTRVWYPMRSDHPQRALARRQMTGGGTIVTFEVAGGKDGAFQVMNRFQLIALSNNLGDSKSLATHPATTTHMRIGEQERARLGITDGVIRVSIGLEDPDDIKDDLRQALAGTAQESLQESLQGSPRSRQRWNDFRPAAIPKRPPGDAVARQTGAGTVPFKLATLQPRRDRRPTGRSTAVRRRARPALLHRRYADA